MLFLSIFFLSSLLLMNQFSLYNLILSCFLSLVFIFFFNISSVLPLFFCPLSSTHILSPYYWKCASEALLLWAVLNSRSSLKVTRLGSFDVSGNIDTTEWHENDTKSGCCFVCLGVCTLASDLLVIVPLHLEHLAAVHNCHLRLSCSLFHTRKHTQKKNALLK